MGIVNGLESRSFEENIIFSFSFKEQIYYEIQITRHFIILVIIIYIYEHVIENIATYSTNKLLIHLIIIR